jgi:hypothetical protein
MSTRPAGIVLGELEARRAYAAAGGFGSVPVNTSTIQTIYVRSSQ